MDAEVKRQLEFVGWLKSKKMYNEFASASTMQNMMAVWEACQSPPSNIVWRGRCYLCEGDGYTSEHNPMGCNCREQQGSLPTCPVQVPCDKCNGTGEITRPATVEEKEEMLKKFIKQGWECKTAKNGRLEIC